MTLIFTSLTAAGCGLLLVLLTALTIRQRLRHKVSLFDGGKEDLQRAIRAHGNFVEFTPIFLILLGLAEMQGLGMWTLYTGLLFIAARLAHAYNLLANAPLIFRQAGMMGSLIPIAGLSVYLLIKFNF